MNFSLEKKVLKLYSFVPVSTPEYASGNLSTAPPPWKSCHMWITFRTDTLFGVSYSFAGDLFEFPWASLKTVWKT